MALQFDFQALGEPFEVLWPVTVNEPIDGGQVRESEFTARFRVLSEEELNLAGANSEDPHGQIRAFFVGLGPESGELDEALFAKLMGRPFVRTGLINAYYRCINGVAVKN